MTNYDLEKQFRLTPKDFFGKLDFINWYRYFFILKELGRFEPKRVLEIGPGEGTIKRVFEPYAEVYETMDMNPKLNPTYTTDILVRVSAAKEKFDAVVAADILEHIQFEELEKAFTNIRFYLKDDGRALITIPHRASNFLLMTPTQIPRAFRVPTGFLSPGAFYRRFIKRKIWIDPDHQWEIGDGKHKIKDVENIIKKAGFEIEKRQKLVYVDFWTLIKI